MVIKRPYLNAQQKVGQSGVLVLEDLNVCIFEDI